MPATHAAVASESDTPPVVFLHAFPLHRGMWKEQVDAVSQLTRALPLDLRGFGARRSDDPFMFEHLADDVLDQLDALGIDDAIFCGLSMGGYLALRLYERAPERFAGLLLCGAHALADTDAQRLRRAQTIRKVLSEGVSGFARSFIEGAVAAHSLEAQPQLMNQVVAMIEEARARDVAAGLCALATRTETTGVLSRISVPTCVVVGALDTLTPPEQVCAMADHIAGATMHAVPNCGHLVNLEQPQVFNALLQTHVRHCLAFEPEKALAPAVGELIPRSDLAAMGEA